MNITEMVNDILKDNSFMDEITDENMKLEQDLGLDSLKKTQVICEMEQQMNIEIDLDDLQPCNFVTVKNLYDLAEKYKAGR